MNSIPSASQLHADIVQRFLRSASAKAAGDVGLRARVGGFREELRRGAKLDDLAVQQKRSEIADARGLLHVVSDGDDGAEVFQLDEELFDFRRADGIEGRAGLIEEKNFGLHGEGASDA